MDFFVLGGGVFCVLYFGFFLRCTYKEHVFCSQMGTEKLIVLVKLKVLE